ncbi:ParB/RepB/Spo0J family partition protein [Nonomuraea sp. NPDC050663]|uniref:ParB/RepB/Spo0J family partition protein n=1 Tax=Nonomuraea sp. NPDC050663 TaxID=3364370 RepID=UPI0037BCCE4E
MTVAAASGQKRSLADLKMGNRNKPQWPDKVHVDQMADNPDNPPSRAAHSDELQELADSIRESGLLQRIVLVPTPAWLEARPEHRGLVDEAKPYVIAFGHRRRYACELAGLVEPPVDVRQSADQSLQNALIENIQRLAMEPLDEAEAIRKLMEKAELSQGGAAKALGKTPAWVSQRLSLLGLIPEMREALKDGRLKLEDARRIGRLPADEQRLPEPAPAASPSPNPVPAPAPAPDRQTATGSGGQQPPRREPSAPTNADTTQGGGAGEGRTSRVDGDHFDEAMRVEGALVQAASQAGNLRALRRVAKDQPDIARRILGVIDVAIDKLHVAAAELRADLEEDAGE